VTRVLNASVLLELPGGAVLTDPFFKPPWYLRFDESAGLSTEQLPPLTVLLGGHRVADHWQPKSLRSYPYRMKTAVYVASRGMARSARRAGFRTVEVLRWGERRRPVSDLEIVCLPGERVGGLRTNSYLVSSGGINVLVSTEARGLGPIRAAAADHRVDVAILPINGIRLLGQPLVMDALTAVEAACLLGASVLIPIHFSQRPIPPVLYPRSGPHDLPDRTGGGSRLAIDVIGAGQRRVIKTAPPHGPASESEHPSSWPPIRP
jgi:L-ascorbate metabolism protein UlaG (beta-lactamase superfamily)